MHLFKRKSKNSAIFKLQIPTCIRIDLSILLNILTLNAALIVGVARKGCETEGKRGKGKKEGTLCKQPEVKAKAAMLRFQIRFYTGVVAMIRWFLNRQCFLTLLN